MDVLKMLVSKVARAFYDPKYIVILDALNNAPPNSNGVREDDLAPVLKMTTRELHSLCGKLRDQRLLKMGTRMENRKQDQRPIPKTFYYLDYKEFVDVVKWKMYQMQLMVREKLRKESENQGYVCQQCHAQYSTLDAMPLARMGSFFCDICSEELKENDNSENVKTSQRELARLREQQQPIINLLKQTDSVVIPQSYTYKPFYTNNKKNGVRDPVPMLSQEQTTSMGDIIVDLQMDVEAARRAKQLEAEEKRQQNALPVWHQRSTVSDTLIGTGDTPVDDTQYTDTDEQEEPDKDLEVDPDTADYYEQYYASLSEAQAPEGEMDGLEESEIADDDNDDDGFEEVGMDDPIPGKRAYSSEDTDLEENKRARLDLEDDVEGDLEDEDIPFVSVNGVEKRLDEISEDDQRHMSTDEYKAYYEAWQNWQNE
ncbi:hypothetical protein DM01DRAFT_1299984 [Hesseltinella vesiculosa]|uniref:HTH TFE/IIEalpha-type domain-containing protein n=1 Tax=Hesseltinella vesiculosa TaxID=101127 RepID=A0A1X2GS15_9FUNG|nr:hypothetical protein DM01DRAFT_1299984 [Hesseltinella vesiculosa]